MLKLYNLGQMRPAQIMGHSTKKGQYASKVSRQNQGKAEELFQTEGD